MKLSCLVCGFSTEDPGEYDEHAGTHPPDALRRLRAGVWEVYDECRWCRAGPMEPCRTPNGSTTMPHVNRPKLAWRDEQV